MTIPKRWNPSSPRLRRPVTLEAIDTTRQRIQDAIRYGKDLRRDSKMYSAADWENLKKLAALPEFRKTIEIRESNNRKVEVKYDTADKTSNSIWSPSAPPNYKRDALDTLFAPPEKAVDPQANPSGRKTPRSRRNGETPSGSAGGEREGKQEERTAGGW